jgi:Phloem protein 2
MPIRFLEVRRLIIVWWFDIGATFSSKNLTPRTRYAVYFIFKLEDDSSGFDLPIEAIVTFVSEVRDALDSDYNKIFLQTKKGTRQNPNNSFRYPRVRNDQWLEVEIGEFYNDVEVADQVGVQVKETKDLWAKRGLIFNGFEFRPKI